MPEPLVLFTGGVQLLILLLGISLHEAAHAWAAGRLGDPTAGLLGRRSLNPLRHLDLFGSLILPVLLLVVGAPLFGWGRPTPVAVRNLPRRRRDLGWIAAAGPMANLALAAGAVAGLAMAIQLGGPAWREAAAASLYRNSESVAGLPAFAPVFLLLQLAQLNAFLAVFHLLPIPPLDGGRILLCVLPPAWAGRLEAVQPFGLLIAVGLALFQVVTIFLLPVYALMGLIIHFG